MNLGEFRFSLSDDARKPSLKNKFDLIQSEVEVVSSVTFNAQKLVVVCSMLIYSVPYKLYSKRKVGFSLSRKGKSLFY